MTKRLKSGAEKVAPLPGRDVFWLTGLAYRPMERCRADWRATNGQASMDDVFGEPGVPFGVVPDKGDLALLLEKGAGWTHDAGSVDPQVIEAWRGYRGEIVVAKLEAPRNSIDVVKHGRERLADNIGLWIRLDEGNYRALGAQKERVVAASKLAGFSSSGGKLIELRKWQAVSNAST